MSAASPARVPLQEVADLIAPGTPLPFHVLDAQGRMLLASGQRVLDTRQLAALLERGACVEYEDVQAVRRARSAAAPAAMGVASAVRQRNWFDGMEQQVWALDELLRGLGRASSPDAGGHARIQTLTDEHIRLVTAQPDAALFGCVRQQDRRFALYALHHALHSATVALLTARQLGWADALQRRVVNAALTMNLSIVELQARMAEQRDPPTKKQLEQIRAHPRASAQLLRHGGVDDADWLSAVEDHHERAGGSGYPRGVAEVGELARLLRAADVYTAKISPRALRPALSPQAAARQLFQQDPGGAVAAALIRAVGLYPPGDIVALKNGETAIVLQRATAEWAVVVVVLFGANSKPVAGSPRRDTGQAEFNIAGPLAEHSGVPRVLPEQVYGLLPA